MGEGKKVSSLEGEKKTNLLIFSTSDFLKFIRPVRYEI